MEESKDLEIIPLLVGYGKERQVRLEAGWGCGYLMVPVGHPSIGAMNEEWTYMSHKDFTEEITWTSKEEFNGVEYIKIGFDTAHGHNTPEVHDFAWVLAKTLEMKLTLEKE